MVTVLEDLTGFVKNNFYDSNFGGFYSSINQNKEDIVTGDKSLLDMGLALLAFSKQHDTAMLRIILEDLRRFQDEHYFGYYELLDSTSIKQEVGEVKTFFTQYLIQYACYVSAQELEDERLLKQAEQNLEELAHKYFESNQASRFTNNWQTAIDSTKQLNDLSLFIYVSSKLKVKKFETESLELLKKFVDKKKGAYSELDVNNVPVPFANKKLLDLSLMILAIESLASRKREEFLKVIRETLDFIDQNYRHPLTKGFWDKSDKDGKVSVNGVLAYYSKKESPFPIKSMLSHVVFLMALNSVSEFETQVEQLKSEVNNQLFHYYDRKNGGINLGQGNWFSTATHPTVPIARQVMVPHYTKGAFYVGNTSYLPLHEKIATLHFLAMLAFNNSDVLPKIRRSRKAYRKSNIVKKLDYTTRGKLMNSSIDIEKYKEWSRQTISGFSYGLTAYRSPLGIKSDKTAQNFSALHVIADKTLLGEKIPHVDELEVSMTASQNADGGFSEQPALLSELFTTYCVVATEYILGKSNYDKEKCIEFVRSCQNEDGGFGNAPGYPSDTWHSNFGAVTLHLLGAEQADKEGLIQYLLSCQNEDGGFGIIPDGISETFSTFRAIDSLTVLGVEIPNKEKVIPWIQSLQDSSGGFLYQENQVVSFVGSYHAIAALYLLGKLPKDVAAVQKWLASHQSLDGGFSRAVGAPSDTTDEGFISIHTAYMLEKKVNPYWIAIIT